MFRSIEASTENGAFTSLTVTNINKEQWFLSGETSLL